MSSKLLVFALVFTLSGATSEVTPAVEAALDRISADGLKGNLSFIASDLLEGRDTPSRGLDLAAEYIAAQFRKAGLEAAGDDGYFQTARFLSCEPKTETFEFKLEQGGKTVTAAKDGAAFPAPAGFRIEGAKVVKVGMDRSAIPDVTGKVVVADGRFSSGRLRALRAAKPALVVYLDRSGNLLRGIGEHPRLVDPDERGGAPWIVLHDEGIAKACDESLQEATATARLETGEEKPVTLRNVIGVLRGSDPALRDTYVLLTAHYDHIGIKPGCTEGDCVNNGANDDGSGTVSVIEIAGALAGMKPRPRRSIVFLTVFGEEKGSYGARYYTRHPVFPLGKTIADVNLEQVGRTDASNGKQVNTATFTGYGFSDLPRTFQAAGAVTGVKVHDTPDSNDYFGRSDNVTFALAGIPAHTLCVAYIYPDYHDVGDSWEKIDYANMARVNRMVALGLIMLADSPRAPAWNAADPKAEPYLKAWRQRHAE